MASKGKGKGPRSVSSGVSGRSDRRSARFRDAKGKEERETLAYKVLTSTQTKEVAELENAIQVQEKMVDLMKLPNHAIDLKEASVLDYYTSAVWWAKEKDFSLEQLSALFTVVHTLLENLKDKQMAIVDNLKEFKKMMVGIGLEHIEGSGGLECFDTIQAKEVSDYVYTSFFQHYRLFEYMFSTLQAEEIIGTDLMLDIAPDADIPWPAPLEDGIAEELYTEFIATPPSTPPPEEEETVEGEAKGEVEGASAAEEEASAKGSERVADLMAQISPDEVKDIMHSLFEEMLGGLQTDVAQKLRDKENAFINRINKIRKVEK